MTDIVTLTEGRVSVFIAVDHTSDECVGSHAAHSDNRYEALEPVRQGVLRHFGGIEKDAAKGLALRHDHGWNTMSGDVQDQISFLCIRSAPSFVRQPEGNGVAERSTRTLKENFLWVHTFDTVEELRRELQIFVAHDNAPWLVARHGYRTPNLLRARGVLVSAHHRTVHRPVFRFRAIAKCRSRRSHTPPLAHLMKRV